MLLNTFVNCKFKKVQTMLGESEKTRQISCTQELSTKVGMECRVVRAKKTKNQGWEGVSNGEGKGTEIKGPH